jgi:hypothetical protein
MSKYAALVKNDTVQPYEKQEIKWKNCTTLLVYLIAFISAMSNLHPHNKFLYLILFSHLFYDYSLTGFSVRTVYTLPIPIYAACSVHCNAPVLTTHTQQYQTSCINYFSMLIYHMESRLVVGCSSES